MPTRTRSRYRNEVKGFTESGDEVVPVSLADSIDEVVALEVNTMEKHAGHPNPDGLRRARRLLVEAMADHVRVPGIRRGDRLVACGVGLTDGESYCSLSYGCDYSLGQGSIAYHMLCLYDPIAYCLGHGVSRLRMGFEALLPKKIRGAGVHPRQLWVWHPDRARLAALGRLLDFLDARTTGYLATLG